MPEAYDGRYRTAADVLENPAHGPQLCCGRLEPLPPHRGGPGEDHSATPCPEPASDPQHVLDVSTSGDVADPDAALREVWRGSLCDQQVRRSVTEFGDRIDGAAARRPWERALAAPAWDGEEVWVHGDLLAGTLLVADGRLSAVTDFGGLSLGDPACDLQPAWNVHAGSSRRRSRDALAVDDASWLRGRGWTLHQAVWALPYSRGTNPGMVRQASHALAEVLADGSR